VEAYNPSKFCQQTCLLQLASNLGREYVIDTLAEGVWDKVGGLAPLFANPNIVKIGHSIGGLDARCLHRDFGIFLCNVFDTYEAARVLNLPSHGLAAVCEHYGMDATEYYKLKEVYQTTDWRKRPLTDEMILYGRYDVHYLLQLRKLMMRDLTYAELFTGGDDEGQLVAESLAATLQRIHDFEDGVEFETASEGNDVEEDDDELGGDRGDGTNGDLFLDAEDVIDESHELVKTTKIAPAHVLRMQPRLMRVISESQDRCMDLWTSKTEPHYRNALFASYMQPPKSTKGQPRPQLTQSQIHLYEDLVRLRNNFAQKEECLPGFLCSLDDLARITIARPTSPEALRIISFFLPESLDSLMNQVFVLTSQSLRTDGLHQGPLDVAVRRYHKHGKSNRTLGFLGKVAIASIAVGALYFVYATRGRKMRR
jgi:3'-5' exonuclease